MPRASGRAHIIPNLALRCCRALLGTLTWYQWRRHATAASGAAAAQQQPAAQDAAIDAAAHAIVDTAEEEAQRK